MEIGCDLATIRDEDLLKKMWQQSEDFSRKREIRTHLCKLRESRLKEFYSTGFGSEIMNPATDVPYGKSPLTPSHGDSLADQSFQSLKAKEVRDSESSVRDIKFRNSGGVAGGVLVPDTSGWNVQTMSEVSPDGRAFRSETLATTEGVEKLQGGVAEFAGRNEQNSSTSHQGDDQNYVKKAAESSKTQLQEKVVIGDENSGRTEMKSSSTMSSSSKVISSSTTKVISGDDPAIEATPRHLPQDQQYEKITSASNTNRSRNEQHHIQRTETNDTKEVSNNHSEENKRYANMDKSSPEYQQHVQYLMSQPGTVVSNTVEYPKPGVKMITTVKKLPDGTTVKTKRYETEPSADNSSISQTPRHHQQQQQHHQQKTTTNSTHKLTEKTVDDAEDVFSRLSRPRDQAGPASPLKTPETSSVEDTQIRLQKTRGEKRFSDTIDQRSTQILRDSTQRSDTPVPSNVTPRRVHDIVDNVETTARSTETVKNIRNQKIISDDFIQKERDRLVPNKDSPVRGEPNDTSVGTRPSQPVGGRPNQVPSNELSSTNVIQQSSKSSEKYSESRRYSTETVESYQHSETHKESQDYTTHGFPSTRRPSDIPRGRSPSVGQPRQDFSTHGFPSVRSDKPTQEYPSEKPKNFDERHQPGNSRQPYSHDTSTTTSRVNETHQHVTTEEFGTQSYPRQSDFPLRPTGQEPSRKPAQGTDRGYPSVRPDAPRDQSPRRPSSGEPSYARPSDNYTTHGYPSVRTDAPRYPPGMEPSEKQYRPDSQGSPTQGQKHGQPTGRKSDDFSTHGFPSVKPGRTTPTPSVDREDTISVASDRSTSVLYEKKIDAAHQAFARSLRCASPVDNIRRDSYSDRQSPRTSISSTRNTYSPSKYDGRSPSRESITNSEFSRVSSGTVTKTQKNTATDGRRPSGPKSPIRKSRPSNISNETIDLSLTRRIRPKPQDSTVKPAGKPSDKPVDKKPTERSPYKSSVTPSDRPSGRSADRPSERPSKRPSESPSERPSGRPSDRPSDRTFGRPSVRPSDKPSERLSGRPSQRPSDRSPQKPTEGTSSTTPRRTTKTLIEDEIDHLIDTSTTLTTPASHSIPTPKKSPKPKETTKPKTPKTIYSSKPKKPTRGYISLNRANQISNRHNETTNKHVSYPHYLSSGPKADRSSPYPEFRQSPSPDRTSIKSRSPARYSNSTSPEPYNAPKTIIDKSKRAPSPSPTRQTSPSPSRVTNVTTTKHTKTIRTDDSITHDINQTKQDRSHKPDDMDEGCVPDISRPQKLKPQEPTSDDEGFEPESPRASSPTSDFEYRGATQTFDEEDSRITKIYKNDRKTVTDDFLRTERKTDHPRGPAENTHKPSQSPTEPKRTNQFPRPNQQSSPKSDSKTPRRPSKDDQKPGEYEPRGPKRSSLTMASEKTNQIDRKQSYTVEEREYSTNRPTNEAKQPTKSIKREPSDGLITYEDKEPKHLAKTPLGRREPSDELKSTHHLKSITKEHAPREPFNKTPGDKRQASPQRSVRQPNESSPKTLPSTIHPADNSQKPRRPKGNEPLDTNHKTPTSQDSPRAFGEPLTSRGPRPQLNRSETYEDRCRQILGIERETIIDQTNEVQDFINIERSSVFTKRPKDESPVGHEADITEKTATTTTKTTKVDHDVSQEEPQDRLTRKPSDKTGRLVDIKKSQADENIERTSRTSTNINIHERKPTAKQPFKSTPSSEYPEDDLLRPKPSAPSLSDEDDQPSKRPDQSPSRKPKGRTPLGFDHIEDQHIRKTTKTTTDSVAELVDSQTKPRLRPEPKDESPEDEQHPDTPSSHRETPLEEEDISYPRRSTTKKTDITVKTSRKDNRTTVETIDIEDSEDYPQERRPRDHLPETEYVSPRRGAPITDYPEHKPSPRTSPTRKPGSESYPRHTEFNAPGERIPKTSFPDNKHPQSTSPFRKPVPESRPGQKSPQSTSPSRIPTSESRPRDYSPEGKPTKKSTPDHRSPQSTSPTRKPTPETRSRDYSPEEKPSKKFSPDHRSPQSTSPTRKPTSESRPRDYSPEEKTNKRSTPDHRSPQRASPTRKPEHKSPQRISPSRKSVPTRGPRDHSPKERIPKAPEDDYSPETDHYSLGERSPKSKRPYGLSPTRKPVYPDESEERHTTNVTILRTDRYPKTNGRSPSPSAKRRLPTDEETGEVTINEKTTAVSKRTTVTRTDTEDYPHKDRPRERSPQKPTSRDESPTGKTHKPRPEDYTIHTTTKTTKLEGITAPRSVSPSKIVAFPNKPRDRSPEIPKTQSTTVTVVHRSIKPGDERVPRTSSPTTEKPRQRSPIGKTTVFQKKINATTNKKDESTIEIVDIQDYPNRRPSPDRPSPTYRTTIPGRNSRETSPSDRRKPDSYPDHTTSTDQPRDSKYATVSIVTKAVITSPDYEVETSPRGSPRQPSPSGRPGREFPTNEETITHRTTKTSSDRKSTTELKLTDHPSPNYPRGSSPTKKTSPRDRSPIEKPWREGPQSYKTSPRDDSPQKPKAPKSTTSTVVQKTIRKGVEHPNENHTRRAPFREPEELTDEDIEESVETVQHSTTRKTVTDRRTVEQIEHDHHRVEEHPQRKPASETPHRTSPTGANQEPRKTRPMSPSKPQAFDTEPRGRKPKGTSTTTRTTPVKVPISSPKSSKQSPTRQHSISPDSSPSRPVSEAESLSPTRSPDTSPIRKTSPKATHITTANFQMSPPATRKKASEPTKPQTSSTNSIQTTTKITTTRSEKPIPNKRDDIPETDGPQSEKSTPKRNPVIERKESAPVPRVTQINKSHQKMSRSTSENTIKTSSPKRPPIHDDNSTSPVNNKGSPKPERRPVKHLTTKTINLSSLDNVIHSEDMENIEIDIQQAKSSREPSPNKIVPIPVPVDLYTGDPRYPDTVQEPEDEPRRKPVVKNIPIYEEESRDFIHCQITEIESTTDTLKNRTKKFIDGEAIPQRADRTTIIGDNVDNECLLSVHDKVSKFISTAEEVCKPKSSAPFRRHVSKEHVPEDDECLLSVDEKVNKFLKTAESVTNEVVTSTTKPLDRPNVHDIDEDLKTDECFLTISQKVNKFTTKAEKLAPTTPQRSPELVSRIERQISKKGEPESPNDSESPTENGSPTTTRKIHHTRSLFERADKKYTDRQIDILSRPSVWSKKSPADVKLEDILDSDGPKQESQPRDDTEEPEPMNTIHPVKDNSEERHSRPVFKPTTDTVSKRKEVFEKKISNQKTTFVPKPHSTSPQSGRNDPHRTHSPTDGSKKRTPLPDQRIPNRLTPQDVQDHSSPVDGIHEDFYGSTEFHETTATGTTFKRQSPERSPTREPKSPRSSRVSESPRQPTKSQPSSRYPNNNSPQHPSGDQSHYHPRQQSHSPIRKSPDPSRTRRDHSPVDRSRQSVETEEYAFTSTQEQINSHYTTHQTHVGTRDSPLTPTSLLDDDDREYSPPRSGATGPSQRRPTTHKTPVSRTIDTSTPRQPRRPSASGSEPSTPRNPKAHTARSTPENVSARRNIFETHSGDVSPKPDARRPSYMEHTKSSLEHRKDSIEVTKSNYSRKSSIDDEYHEISPRTTIKFNTGLRHREEPKLKRKPSSSDLANIEDIYDLEFLEEMLNIVTVYEQRRRIRAQIRVVKKLLETKTKDEVARMTKITSLRKASVSSARDSPVPRRESTTRSDKYHPSDDIDSESVIESQHVEEHEEVIHEKKSSPRTKTSRTVTKVTEIRKAGEHSSPKRPSTKKDEPRDSKPIWATKNILKKPSENEKVTRALSSKRTTSTTSSSTVRTQQAHRQRPSPDEDCITSSYGIGPTDEDGRPLFGIRALKKKSTTTKGAQPSETMKVTGTVVTEKYYSENGAEPVGEREVTMYSTNPEDLEEIEYIHDRRDSDTIKQEVSSKDGLTTVTKVQRIGKFKPEEHPALTDDPDAMKTSSKTVRRGSVKEMSEKFIRKESSSSVTEKSSGYPKAGLIYRTQSNSGATADAADQYEIRSRSVEHDEESDNECSVEMRSTRRHSKQTTENENETEIRRTINTKSFLNSAGSRVTGMDDVLERMRNADNVVVDGDTEDDREARALLNKFIGASVIMSGVESIVPQKELKRTIIRPDGVKEVKTTRVTKTIKSTGTGGNSSTPVARETCAFEEIWDEEYLKDLLEKSTNYEERRLIRARIRQLMAEREGSSTTTEKTETKKENGGIVTTTTKVTTRTVTGGTKPVSPFTKFQQLDKQNSLQSPKSPLTPSNPGGSSSTPIFRFTDPALNARAATVKEQLLQWCQSKTQEYENVQITNFSTSWTDGLAFCALIHHFLPDAFDYSKLNPKQRRHNFELAFRVADEKAGIAPLLDVEDMVVMKRPDWKCVFTYVQTIYRRFRNCQ